MKTNEDKTLFLLTNWLTPLWRARLDNSIASPLWRKRQPISMSKPLKNQAVLSLLSLFCFIMGKRLGNGNSLFRKPFLESFSRSFYWNFNPTRRTFKTHCINKETNKKLKIIPNQFSCFVGFPDRQSI